MTRQDGKVDVRIGHLKQLKAGQLPAAVAKAGQLWEQGLKPETVRVRRSYVVQDTLAPVVVDERKPLPREERPISARMITPKGLSLKLHLL
ncbi:hypothetical protein [Streptomyces atratus]